MFGKNPIRPPEKGDGSRLNVVEIFATLQGEGPFVGHPAVFVRLGGCNLACDFCDTEFEQFEEMTLASITQQVEKLVSIYASPLAGEATRLSEHSELSRSGGGGAPKADTHHTPSPNPLPQGERAICAAPLAHKYLRDLVVITGGEPLRQNIAPLCQALLAKGLRVQIETNGTLWRELPQGVNIVCSPKATDGKYHPLRPDLLARVDALKFIVSAEDAAYRSVGEVGQSTAGRDIPIYVQPMDTHNPTQNAANTAHALALAQTNGYRLSIQMHKLWGIA